MYAFIFIGASLIAQLVKNPSAMQETLVLFLGWEDPLEKEAATHSSILAWQVPLDRGASRARVHRVTKSQTQLKRLSMHTKGTRVHMPQLKSLHAAMLNDPMCCI